MNKKEIENKIRNFLHNREEISFAYLFGSFIKKDHYRDIDVAVYLYKSFQKNNMEQYPFGYESFMISELNLLVRKKIDFVVMNNADIMLQQRIIKNGSLLFSKDIPAQKHYENLIRKLYIDAEPLRRIKRYYLTKNITHARY